MITGEDLYKVMCAMVPLYLAMLVAYVSVKWCKIFSTEQCSGINRFVAVFAVPVLSFHFISLNNPYQMDAKFVIADTLSKLIVLLLLSLWAIFFANGSLDWLITLFSLATLPNTLVMGIPLLQAMYGHFTQSLMVQLLVLQCIIWYTLLLFLFEYRAATVLIRRQFPGQAAASISKIEVDGDVISLDGHDMPLRTESETDDHGRIRVRIRRSISSAPDSSVAITTPRPSNLSNADIFSINTPPLHLHDGAASPNLSGYASSDAYSLQPTPRASNFHELEAATPVWSRSPATAGRVFRPTSPVTTVARESPPGKCLGEERESCKDITMSDGIWKCLVLSNHPSKSSLMRALGWLWLFMALQPRIIACGTKRAVMGMVIRFLCGPLVMFASSIAIGLRQDRLHTAIVQAALPQGIVPFVFAREYGLHPDILSTG
ncbi:hypothetical protein Fmac_032239 [Flemingia macrophylla]|uniref:Auxin efflux carrier component n=1 Tax=Flemingia macrophylla TaxID=520843 RepID=A0ABD1L4S0_9FABA